MIWNNQSRELPQDYRKARHVAISRTFHRLTNTNVCTQWVHVSTAVSHKAGWMLEDGSRTSWLLSANCRVAVRPQIYRRESRVLYELIFVAFDWFRMLMPDHLLILTHITLTLHYIHESIVSKQHHRSSRHKKERTKPKPVSRTNSQSHRPKYREVPSFWHFQFL